MLKLLSHPYLHVSAARASGTVTADDYEKKLLPDLRTRLELYPQISWYFEMEDFKGWTPGAFWDDHTFALRFARKFKRIALVGDSNWEKFFAPLMRPFTSATVKFFPITEKEKGWDWVGQ